jgi:hypothetical protein
MTLTLGMVSFERVLSNLKKKKPVSTKLINNINSKGLAKMFSKK